MVIIGMGLWVLGVMSLDWKSDRFIGVSDEVNRLTKIEAQLAKIASFLERQEIKTAWCPQCDQMVVITHKLHCDICSVCRRVLCNYGDSGVYTEKKE